ncbi:hypothetical protein RvY_06718 [Ramazzottius varieornatus]|uniref:Kazal-like domain-containing protein n=1 Tax=Ramazzottius varieornatus TaxID=947166 RepID=A0A1D1UZX9_RAMVA|nr:hypothetical protein RvY_06718 [Ramazzottius varieornatus]
MQHTIGILAFLCAISGSLAAKSAKVTKPPTAEDVEATTRKYGGQAQAACKCQGFAQKYTKVCGTDYKTYETACTLAEAMKTNATLGLLCTQACPCKKPSPQLQHCTANYTISYSSKLRASKFKSKIVKAKPHPNHVKKYCLTDGSEENRDTIFCALGTKSGVGIRCMANCKQCKTINDACPSKLLQAIPLEDEAHNVKQ